MDKNQVITELYALRSGLSLISQNCDKVKEIERQNYLMREAAKLNANELENRKQRYNEQKELFKTLQGEQFTESENISAQNRNLKKIDVKINVAASGLKSTSFVFIAPVLIVILFLSFAFSTDFTANGWLILLYVCAYISGMVIAVNLIFFICYLFSYLIHKCRYNKLQLEIEQAKNVEKTNFIKDKENRLRLEQEKLNSEISLINSDEQEHQALIELQANKKEMNNESLNALAINSQDISDSLDKQYGNLINIADWQNIDLIIFYLQTGRADTLKEALQQADRQRQNDIIVSEIKNASRTLEMTIRDGFGRLGRAMGECFSALSSQMHALHYEVINNIQGLDTRLSSEIKAIDTQTKKLVTATDLSNALLDKASKTSEELLNDLRYQQEYLLE